MKSLVIAGSSALLAAACARPAYQPSANELRSVADAATPLTSLGHSLAVGDGLFGFGTPFDAAQSDTELGAALLARVKQSLGGCGSATVDPKYAVVTVDLGAAPGCTLAGRLAATGSVVIALVKKAGSIDPTTDLMKVVARGKELNGAVWYCTQPAFTASTVILRGQIIDKDDVMVTGGDGAFTFSGNANIVDDKGNPLALYNFANTAWRAGDCYPNGGSMIARTDAVPLTIEFSPATSSSGEVTVTHGENVFATALPPYGVCPPVTR